MSERTEVFILSLYGSRLNHFGKKIQIEDGEMVTAVYFPPSIVTNHSSAGTAQLRPN